MVEAHCFSPISLLARPICTILSNSSTFCFEASPPAIGLFHFPFAGGVLTGQDVSCGRPPGSFFISFLVCVRCFLHLSIKFSGVREGGPAPALSTAIYFRGVPGGPVLYGNVSAIIRTEIKKCWKVKGWPLKTSQAPRKQ